MYFKELSTLQRDRSDHMSYKLQGAGWVFSAALTPGFLPGPGRGDPQKGVKSLYIKDRLFHFLAPFSTGKGGIGGKK